MTEKLYKLFEQCSEISTDSRNITSGCLFFALKGEKFNGNQYAADAISKGALFAVIDEPEFAIKEKTIVVDNVLKSLQEMARHHRDKLAMPILAITGTNGKTTTKELVSAVLAQKYRVCSTQGNLNNHIGVPLTLLKMNTSTQFGVVEMGANHPGDISELCAIANPDFGIITNVGKAHLEGFGSFEGVKRTKAELYAHLAKNDGLIFINSGNIHLKEMSATNSNRFTYGDSSSDLSGYIIGADPFLRLEIKFGEKIKSVKTNLTGKYNYENVLAAASVGVKFGIEPEKIIAALEKYTPKNNRSQWIEKESVKIIMDAYNANPTSMLSSLESFLSEDIENKALILGDMLELGEYSASEHLGILQYVASRKCRHVYCVGTEFSKIAGSFGFYSFNDVAQLTEYISQNTIDKKLILIKGSRGIRLEKVLDVFN